MVRVEQVQQSLSQGRIDEAVSLAQDLVHEEPSNGQAWKVLSFGRSEQQNWIDAKQAALRANSIIPGDYDIYYTLGYASLQLKELEDSLRYAEQALQLNHAHTGARQVKHLAMLEIGRSNFDRDPVVSESILEQLLRFDPGNLEVIRLLLKLYEKSDKKVKLANLIKGMTHGQALNPPLSIEIEQLSNHPELGPIVKNAMITHRGNMAQTIANQASAQAQNPAPLNDGFMPCKSCGNRIADFAITCPYCKTQLKQSRFAGREAGLPTEWQPTALTIMAVLYLLLSIAGLVVTSTQEGYSRFGSGILGVIISIGIIFRQETLMSIAKWVLMIRIGIALLGLIIGLSIGDPWTISIGFAVLGLSGFLLYLVNYESQY